MSEISFQLKLRRREHNQKSASCSSEIDYTIFSLENIKNWNVTTKKLKQIYFSRVHVDVE